MSSQIAPNRPEVSRADLTRASIVETAERLFRTLGYQKTTVADIARELSMSPANVYRFFPSKAAINEAICATILTAFADGIWRIARGPGTPPERLRAVFSAVHRQTMDLFFTEKRLHDMVDAALDEHWAVIEDFIHQVETAIRHIVMDGQASGDFAALPPDTTALLIHKTMIGFAHPTLVAQCADADLAQLAAGMAEFVLRALRP